MHVRLSPARWRHRFRQVVVDTGNGAKYLQTAVVTQAQFTATQPDSVYAPPTVTVTDLSLPDGLIETRIPFKLFNNHIYADVAVNGHGPMQFIFDTGGHDILTIMRQPRELGGESRGRRCRVLATGGRASRTLALTKINKLQGRRRHVQSTRCSRVHSRLHPALRRRRRHQGHDRFRGVQALRHPHRLQHQDDHPDRSKEFQPGERGYSDQVRVQRRIAASRWYVRGHPCEVRYRYRRTRRIDLDRDHLSRRTACARNIPRAWRPWMVGAWAARPGATSPALRK